MINTLSMGVFMALLFGGFFALAEDVSQPLDFDPQSLMETLDCQIDRQKTTLTKRVSRTVTF